MADLTELARASMPYAEVLGLDQVDGDAEKVTALGTWAAADGKLVTRTTQTQTQSVL